MFDVVVESKTKGLCGSVGSSAHSARFPGFPGLSRKCRFRFN